MNIKEKRLLASAILEKKKRVAKKKYHSFSAEYLYITNKAGERIKLEQNNVQRQLEEVIQGQRDKGIPPRVIILKSRQMGISTDTEGRMVYDTTTKENKNGLAVAHRDDSTAAIFAKTKYFYDNLHKSVQPLKQASNAKELIFNEPTHYKGTESGINSKIKVQTAGSAGIGRSDTYHFVHLSEFGFWSGSDTNSPAKQLTGIMQSVPNIIESWVIIESTANGMNDFKNEWDKAVNGESAFTPLFLAWYDHEEYVTPVNNVEYFKQNMSEYEKWLYNDMDLPIERVAWWRWCLKNKCNGDINQMKQENPTTAEEAFIFSGTPVFDNDIVRKRIAELQKSNRTYKEGYFNYNWHNEEHKDYIIDGSIKFIESATKKYWRVYTDKVESIPYVLAGDTKGEGNDEYTAHVMDNTTSKRVATCQMQLNNSKPFAWQVYCAGKYFNYALVGIEMNFNTGPLEELERLKYKNQYYREKSEGFNGEIIVGKLGWKTDGVTRPRMIDKEVYTVSEYIHLIEDIPTLQQMLTFIYDKNNRPDAMSGKHDDLLIADCILTEIRSQQDTFIKTEEVEEEDSDMGFMKNWNNYY